MNNNILTYKQYIALIISTIISINFVILPLTTGSLISIALGMILSVIYTLFFLKTKDRINLNNKYVKYIFSVKFIITAGILVAFFSEVACNVFLENTNAYSILTLCFIATAYCSLNGNSINIISRILYFFILIPVLSVIIFSLWDIKLNNITDNYYNTNLIDVFTVSISTLIFEIAVMLSSFLKKKTSVKKLLMPILFSVVVLILVSICIIGRFGKSAYMYKYPSFELMYSADLPGYIIQRQEGILISVFLLGILISISLFMWFSATVGKLFNRKYINYILIYVVSAIVLYFNNIINVFIIYNFFGGIIFIILAFILKGGSYEE